MVYWYKPLLIMNHPVSRSNLHFPFRNGSRIARWLLWFPLAVAGGAGAGFLVDLMNRIAIFDYQDPQFLLVRLYVAGIPGLAAGAAGVFIASVIAPAQRKKVALVFAAVVCLLSLFSAYWALSPGLAHSSFPILFALIGSWGMTYTIQAGELNCHFF